MLTINRCYERRISRKRHTLNLDLIEISKVFELYLTCNQLFVEDTHKIYQFFHFVAMFSWSATFYGHKN